MTKAKRSSAIVAQHGATKWLLTSDWQCCRQNFSRIEATVEHILELIPIHNITVVFILGDLKEAYNPVDLRVVEFMLRMLRKIRRAVQHLIVFNGNHDRLSQVNDTENWGDLLQEVGLTYIDKPQLLAFPDMPLTRVACVPWTTENVNEAAKALGLASYLMLHTQLKGALMNAHDTRGSDEGFDSNAIAYKGIYAGHVHGQQKVGDHSWQVGSPFCQTWGEANERKGFLVVEPQSGETTPIESRLPMWYDPSLPNFVEPKTFFGANVRVHAGSDQNVHAVQEEAATRYAGANITVIHDTSIGEAPKAKKNTSDTELIDEYIAANAGQRTKKERRQIAGLLTTSLKIIGQEVQAFTPIGFRVESFRAKNVLSFKTVEFSFETGLTVVRGLNYDDEGESVASGKTNLFQLPLILLYGKTRKGQEAEEWRRRGSAPKISVIRGTVRRDDGKVITIKRGRKPKGLRFWVDGVEKTSGKNERECQRALDGWLGRSFKMYLLQTFVDHQQENIILHGTPGERQTLFSELLDLSRFQAARMVIEADMKRTVGALVRVNAQRIALENQAQTMRQLAAAIGGSEDIKQTIAEERAKLDALAVVPKPKRKRITDNRHERRIDKGMIEQEIERLRSLREKTKRIGADCPVCGQVMTTAQRMKRVQALTASIAAKRVELEKKNSAYKKLNKRCEKIEAAYHSAHIAYRQYVEQRRSTKLVISTQKQLLKQKEDSNRVLQVDLTKMTEQYTLCGMTIETLQERQVMLNFCMAAFHRNGIPREISKRMVPQLNKAIKAYAEHGNQKLHAEFTSGEGTVDLQIHNPHGGDKLNGQSTGETQILSLTVSLAVRLVIGFTGMLVCDEPGHGLSPGHAARFAKVLLDLPARFSSVLIASHNPYLLDALGTVKTITVSKQNGISKVER